MLAVVLLALMRGHEAAGRGVLGGRGGASGGRGREDVRVCGGALSTLEVAEELIPAVGWGGPPGHVVGEVPADRALADGLGRRVEDPPLPVGEIGTELLEGAADELEEAG